jgi:hypothetical protein
MTGIAFCRDPSRGIDSLKLEKRELGTIDRGWQDKSRKVRPVDRVRNSVKSSLASHIANVSSNLRSLATRRHRSAFDTLRRTQ